MKLRIKDFLNERPTTYCRVSARSLKLMKKGGRLIIFREIEKKAFKQGWIRFR
jgi:hypothetical protein